ncbi:MAG: hypothetical protein HC921_15100 [Synechococcaceae cyanobacterium SM2_3_1]|nr:hypothetical protein [Synechococcaceae cyanobacterium SM2_3_1]
MLLQPISFFPPPPPPRPILCMTSGELSLYAELIQPVEGSQQEPMLWVRPLLLVSSEDGMSHVEDLRQSSDLLWLARDFVPAYAEDILPLLDQLGSEDHSSDSLQVLQRFLQRAWKHHS